MRNRSGRTLALLLSLTLLLSISSSFFPTLTAAQGEPPVYSTPLGIALESYPYPYPVQYLPLEISGQPVRMAYMDVHPDGKGNGRVVMLLHGKNFYGESGAYGVVSLRRQPANPKGSYWENTIKALSKAGYRVVVPDQIGFGKSAKPDIAYSFDLLATNTAQLLDELKVDKVAVVGHSMGGMLAVRNATAITHSEPRI